MLCWLVQYFMIVVKVISESDWHIVDLMGAENPEIKKKIYHA